MSSQVQVILQQREQLKAKIAEQRVQIAKAGARWALPLSVADQGLEAVRYVRSHPLLWAGAATLLVLRRGSLFGLLRTGWRVWTWYGSVKRYSRNMMARFERKNNSSGVGS